MTRRITFRGLRFMGYSETHGYRQTRVTRPSDKHTLDIWYYNKNPGAYYARHLTPEMMTVASWSNLDELDATAILHHFRYGKEGN